MELRQPARLVDVEAIEQHQRAGCQHRQGDVSDQSGDVKQRRQPENHVLRRQSDPALVHRCGEHDIAMRVHGGFRLARGARRVDHERHVVAGDLDRLRRLARVRADELEQIGGVLVAMPPRSRQHTRRRRRVVEQIEGRRGDRVLHGGGGQGRARDVGVQVFLGDEDAAARVGQDLGQLTLAQHRVARHDDGAALPGGEHGHEHLRHVLQVHRDALAMLRTARLQRHRQRVRPGVELTGGDRPIEVVHEGRVAVSSDGVPEHLQARAGLRLNGWRDRLVEARATDDAQS